MCKGCIGNEWVKETNVNHHSCIFHSIQPEREHLEIAGMDEFHT